MALSHLLQRLFPPKPAAGPAVVVSAAGEAPAELVSALREGRCLLFTGEEFSRLCGCPTWSYMLLGIGEHMADTRRIERADGDKLRQIHHSKNFAHLEKVIRMLLEGFPEALPEYLAKVYKRPLMMPPSHEWLRKLPFAGLVTPTFDPVAIRMMGGEEKVYRLRGEHFWPEDAATTAPALCTNAVRGRTVLFAGTSGEEIDRWFAAEGEGPHFALVPEGQALKTGAKYGIRSVTYEASNSVALVNFLKKLDVATREDHSDAAQAAGP